MGDVAPGLATRTVGQLTREMSVVLAPSLGEGAEREARELLAALHDMPRHWPATARDLAVNGAAWDDALGAAARRAGGAPLQYAAGRAAFRHLSLVVDERVLIPRPETELLVELVLHATRDADGGTAVDVGTGSGAIALALASEGRFASVIGTDISADALDVARANVARCAGMLRAVVALRQGSLLAPVSERGVRAVVSNPPYIAYGEASRLPSSVRDWEPSVALFSGADGLTATRRLIAEAAQVLAPRGVLALEVDSRRAARVAADAQSHGAYQEVQVHEDLTGRERFVVARRREDRE